MVCALVALVGDWMSWISSVFSLYFLIEHLAGSSGCF